MFSGGNLLGTFKGPATRGQRVEIQSANRWENKFGRYLIIQMNFGNAKNFLHLEEAFALGVVAPSKMVPATATLSTTYKHFYAKKCINPISAGGGQICPHHHVFAYTRVCMRIHVLIFCDFSSF